MYKDNAGKWHGVSSIQQVPPEYKNQVESITSLKEEQKGSKDQTADKSSGENIEGFRGYRWGDKPSVLGEIKDTKKIKNGVSAYKKRGELFKLGEIYVPRIVYIFENDKLTVVLIGYKGFSNFSDLKQTLQYKYGEPIKPNKYEEQYFWIKKYGYALLKYSDISEEGQLVIGDAESIGKKSEDDEVLRRSVGDF